MSAIDLGDLARAYRLRPMTEAAIDRAAAAAHGALDPLLDIGGGTGAHAGVWATLGRSALVLDVSDAMVDKAKNRSGVSVVQGDAETLPFQHAQFGLAYFHMSIHYGDWRKSLSEAVRVVRPGGRIEVWTFAPEDLAGTSLGRWFPSVVGIDTARFPSPHDLANHLGPLVQSVTVETAPEEMERTARSWVESVRGRFVSTLQLVDATELDAGVAAFRTRYPNDDDVYRYSAPFTAVTCVV